MNLNRSILKTSLLLLTLVELLSLVSHVFSPLNTVAFFVSLTLVFFLSLKHLEVGLYIVIAELIVGSFGQIFFWNLGDIFVGIRVGLFLVIMSVWLGKVLISRDILIVIKDFWGQILSRRYLFFGIFLIWGLVWGLLKNDFANVFFDFNSWLYFLYIFPFWQVFKYQKIKPSARLSDKLVKNTLTVIASGIIVLSIKTIILEWFFAHQIAGTLPMLYVWIRDFRLGEITFFANNFYRIFLQSQIWLLLGFFMFLGVYIKNITTPNLPKGGNKLIWLTLLLSSTSLIISFSRSFWLGLIAGLGVFFLLILFKFKWSFKRVFKWGISIIGILIVEVIFIFALINIPLVEGPADLGSIVSNRLTSIEVAGSSRINLLKPLMLEIVKHPIIGSGFGTTVTYKSVDPRVVARTAAGSGEYTTYAFEWGYLDIILKIGLVGFVIYVGLLTHLLKILFNRNDYIYFGFFLALIALIVTNITTPYLNHPLGIGFVVLVTVLILDSRRG